MASAKQTVLVVDDDPDVLSMITTYLDAVGFDVISAPDGDSAIKLIDGEKHIDLLVTDIVMPGKMDGFEVAHRAKNRRPDIRIMYISGFLKTIPWGDKGIGYGPMIEKPFRMDALEKEIRSALN